MMPSGATGDGAPAGAALQDVEASTRQRVAAFDLAGFHKVLAALADSDDF